VKMLILNTFILAGEFIIDRICYLAQNYTVYIK